MAGERPSPAATFPNPKEKLMAYASRADIEELYGLEYIVDLLPNDVEDDLDREAALEAALESASAEIDGYLSVRYTLPLGGAPVVLRRPAIDIAAYVLANRQSRLTNTIETRYEQSVGMLKRIADGKAGLGRDEPSINVEGTSSQSGSFFSANPRRHRRGVR